MEIIKYMFGVEQMILKHYFDLRGSSYVHLHDNGLYRRLPEFYTNLLLRFLFPFENRRTIVANYQTKERKQSCLVDVVYETIMRNSWPVRRNTS